MYYGLNLSLKQLLLYLGGCAFHFKDPKPQQQQQKENGEIYFSNLFIPVFRETKQEKTNLAMERNEGSPPQKSEQSWQFYPLQ